MSIQKKPILQIIDYILCVCVLVFGVISSYYIERAPSEQVMGIVQKIMYFHVGSAIACYTMLAISFISAVCFLTYKKLEFYHSLNASTSVSFIFCSIVLLTGMVWGHSSWNTWWRWEPRLTSVLILWVMLFSIRYLQFSKFNLTEKSLYMSVMGILASVQVPIIMFSIKLLNHTEQLHPEVVAKRGLQDSGYVTALIYSNICLVLLSIVVYRIAYKIFKIENIKLQFQRKLNTKM